MGWPCKIFIIILFFCVGCLSQETKEVIRKINDASSLVRSYPVGNCVDRTQELSKRILEQEVNPRFFSPCILGKLVECSKENCSTRGKHKHLLRHMVLLFYGWDYPVIVTTTGVVSDKSFICLEEAYQKTGYFIIEILKQWEIIDNY